MSKKSKNLLSEIEKQSLFWIKAFGLNITRLNIINDSENENVKELIEMEYLMSVSRQPSSAYQVNLFINPIIIGDLKTEEVGRYCCHEIMHCILDELCWSCGVEDSFTNPSILAKHEEIVDKIAYLLTKDKGDPDIQVIHE